MPYERHLIAPFNTGLQTDLKPWLIMEDAFTTIKNAYVFRGRVRKRFGSTLMSASNNAATASLSSRLRVALPGGSGVGTTNGSGNATGTAPGNGLAAQYGIGQLFSIGSQFYTVKALGVPGTMLATDASTIHTFNTTTGVYQFAGAPANTQIYFYPAFPVMGLPQYDTGAVNNFPTLGFDYEFAYQYTAGSWQRSVDATVPAAPEFHGGALNFFWTINGQAAALGSPAIYTSNFNVHIGLGLVTDDPIWYFDGTNWLPYTYSPDATLNPTNRQPTTVTLTTSSAGTTILSYVQSSLIIVFYHERMIFLNTIENNANGAGVVPTGITPVNYLTSTNTQYAQRARWSIRGSPFASNAWLEPGQVYNPSGAQAFFAADAGALDADTEEAIVGAEFIKDQLIVYFENSTWQLVYTGNNALPFSWQRINVELGCQSTFSTVPFDRSVLGFGNVGIHSCNGANVQRIDEKIPDVIFAISNQNQATQKIYGIRDYYTECVYWSYLNSQARSTDTFNNTILVYNYRNNSWSVNLDCITVFGYFDQQPSLKWNNQTITWEDANFTWESGDIQQNFRQIIAGNPQGFVYFIQPDVSRNSPVWQITDITGATNNTLTIMNHNLNPGEFIAIENAQGITAPSVIYEVLVINNANTITIGPWNLDNQNDITGTYTGGGTATLVSNIQVESKQWNPYIADGRDIFIAKIDFGVLRTQVGQIYIAYSPSASEINMASEAVATNSIVGTSILETFPYPNTFEVYQDRVWHPVYFQSEGECIQLNMFMTPTQMRSFTVNTGGSKTFVAWEDFQLEGIILYAMPTTWRPQ